MFGFKKSVTEKSGMKIVTMQEWNERGRSEEKYRQGVHSLEKIICDLEEVVPGLDHLVHIRSALEVYVNGGERIEREGLDRLIAAQKAEASLDFARHMRETYGIGKPVEKEEEQS